MKTIPPSQISRTCAELLEPLATLPNAGEYADKWGMSKGTNCWRPEFTNEVITDIVWAERDFEHDPRGTVMLLVWLGNNPSDWNWYYMNWSTQADLQKAVARAFLLAHNITVEG